MEANQEDINSLFDCISLSEDRLVGEGYEKGYREGLEGGGRGCGGRGEGRLDFISGIVEQWKEVYQGNSGNKKTERVVVALNKLARNLTTIEQCVIPVLVTHSCTSLY
jgi:hypothetical protein